MSTLQIDRGFVHELETSADDLAIVRAVVGLADALDLNVVAEGSTQRLLAEGRVATTIAS